MPGAANRYLETSNTAGGVVELVSDRSVVEQDSVRPTTAGTAAFDTVAEVQTLIANAIEDAPDAADKVLNIFYGFNTSSTPNQTDGFIIGSNMGSVDTADLDATDNFSVMSLARIVGLNQGMFDSTTLETD